MEINEGATAAGRIDALDSELWVVGHALDEPIRERETLQRHGVKTVAILRVWQTAIRQGAHLEPGSERRLAMWINQRAQALLAHGMATEIHWVLGHSGMPGHYEADHQVNLTRDASRSMADRAAIHLRLK
jgi:hypothetical protein